MLLLEKEKRSIKTILIVFILFSILFASCASFKNLSIESNKQELPALIPYRVDKKWGFCDRYKKIVIPAVYDEVDFFSDGLAAVRINGNWGYIDTTGKLVIPAVYRDAFPFNGGLALVDDTNGKYSFIDKKGNIVIPPKNAPYTLMPAYKSSSENDLDCSLISFNDGLYPVILKNSLRGYIDEKGNLAIILPKSFDGAERFYEGFARVHSINGGYGFIDKTGKLITKQMYESAGVFSEGLAAVETYSNSPNEIFGKWGFIDTTGNLVIPAKYDNPYWTEGDYYFKEGYCRVKRDGKYYFIDRKGNEVLSLDYYAEPFSEGLALVASNAKYGFINTKGEIVIPMIYDGAKSFSEGLAAVQLNGKWGYIDKTGKVVIPMIYDVANKFKNGLALVYTDPAHAGYIDKNGTQYWEDN